MPAKLTEEQYYSTANKRNLKWVGVMPNRTIQNTTWICSSGHTFEASYNNIQAGKGCPVCHFAKLANAKKLPPDAYHVLALKRDFQWQGEMPATTFHKTEWRCPEGHIFSSRYSDIRSGYGCPTCGNIQKGASQRHTSENYHALASAAGYTWVGELPHSVNDKTKWQCPEGHIFEMWYANFKTGQRCPLCKNMVNGVLVSKPQLTIHALIGGELNYKFGRYCLDVALEPNSIFRVAVEYDCAYWHKPERDAKRDEWLVSHGWRILRIKSGVLIPTLSELQDAIERLRAGETYIEIILPDWGK